MQIKRAFKGSGAIKSLIAMVFLVISVALVLNPVSLQAADANDTITLNVNISEIAAIEVLPTAVTWNQLQPGSNGTATDLKNISVKNIGSYNLTNFYIDVNTEELETENPIGTSNISKYAAGGFILFRNESTDLDYFHLGRLEWNLTEIMDTEVLDLSPGVTKFGHGWYRKANGNEYLWKLENGTQADGNGAWCNTTSANLVIIKNPENASGYSRDFSAGNTATAPTPGGSNANWTFFHFTDTEGGPLAGRCVAAYYDCTRIYIYKYDKSDGFKDCAISAYFATEELAPGERLDKLKIKPSIPQGTPSGDSKTSTLTVYTSIA